MQMPVTGQRELRYNHYQGQGSWVPQPGEKFNLWPGCALSSLLLAINTDSFNPSTCQVHWTAVGMGALGVSFDFQEPLAVDDGAIDEDAAAMHQKSGQFMPPPSGDDNTTRFLMPGKQQTRL